MNNKKTKGLQKGKDFKYLHKKCFNKFINYRFTSINENEIDLLQCII